jgi:membrane fusion protein, multidrug efflux system
MIKRFLIAFVLLGIVCGGLVYFNMFRAQAIEDFFANRPQPAVAVSAMDIEPLTWTPGIEAIGTASAVRGIDLAIEAAGVVEAVNFSSNDRVEEGMVLVQLDDTIEQADLQASRAAVNLSEQVLDRASTLRTRGVGAASNVDEAEADAQSSRAQVARLEAILNQKALEAPFSGMIGIPRVEVGQYVTSGTVVATLQDLDTMRADFSVPEQRLRELSIGQSIRLGAEEGELNFNGTITGIEPRIDPNTRLVSVRAQVDNSDGSLSPGQFVRVRVVLPEENNVIAVPQTAVVASLYGDFVYAIEPADAEAAPAADAAEPAAAGEAAQAESADTGAGASDASEAPASEAPALQLRQIFVQTGRRNGRLVEIVEGLEPGMRIVTTGQNRLSNGIPVTIDPNESRLETAGAQQ